MKRSVKGEVVARPRDPLNPERRLTIRGSSQAEVDAKLRELHRQAQDYRLGLVEETTLRARVEGVAGGPLKVRDAWDRHVAASYGESWAKQAASIWRNHLEPYVGDMTVVQLTSDVWGKWEKKLQEQKYSQHTICLAYNCLAAAVRRQKKEHRIGLVPWGDWRPRTPARRGGRSGLRTVEELGALLEACRSLDLARSAEGASGGGGGPLDPGAQRFADLYYRVAASALTGMRQGELAALCWSDLVNLDQQDRMLHGKVLLYVRHQAKRGWKERHPEWERPLYRTKSRERSPDPDDPPQVLHPSAIKVFIGQRWNLQNHGFYRPDGPVFPSRRGAWRTHPVVIRPDREWEKVCTLAGIDPHRMPPHGLRHTFGTLEALASSDLKGLQLRGRWRSLKIAQGYMHDAGRGLPVSNVPELPIAPPTVATFRTADEARQAIQAYGEEPSDPWELAPAVPLVDPADMPQEAALAVSEARKGDRRAARREAQEKFLGRSVVDMARAAERWAEQGFPGLRPEEVNQAAARAYTRVYQSRHRALAARGIELTGQQKKAALAAALAAKGGTIGAWERFAKEHGYPMRRGRKAKPRQREPKAT